MTFAWERCGAAAGSASPTGMGNAAPETVGAKIGGVAGDVMPVFKCNVAAGKCTP